MNVVYILGNGFDKAQGMATSYPEFYRYLDLEERSALIEQLKKEIKSDKEQWSDMEEAFGKFSSKIDTEDNFTELYFDLTEVKGCFSLRLNPYELGRMESSYEVFVKVMSDLT